MIKPVEYLERLGIRVTRLLEKEIKTSWDLDAVMDASYIYNTDYIDTYTFHNAQEYLHNYFNGNISYEDDNYIDLSDSPTATYSHYLKEEIPDDTNVVEVDLENNSRYYEIPV